MTFMDERRVNHKGSSSKSERTEVLEKFAAKLAQIEVYAFVGPAGTGKSQRATQVARQHGIDMLIDDGLVIARGRIAAGRSAKSEINMVRAIRRAIFDYEAHRDEVVEYLAKHTPDKLMILATSDGMIRKIIKRLGLNAPSKIINITDVATPQEIKEALRERREKKQHVVPVARAQIQRNFAGKLVSQLRSFFKSKDKDKDQESRNTIVKPPFSFNGKVTIGTDALLAMCRRLLEIEYVHTIHDLTLEPDADDSLDVNVVLDLTLSDRSVLSIARLLQKKVRIGLSYFTGIEVKKVNIQVNEVYLPQ